MPGFEIIGEEERRGVNDVFDNGAVFFRHGFDAVRKGMYKVREFEAAFAKKLAVPYAQSVTSGTVALKVALKALGVGPGDEVITQCHTFVATVEAILDCGATPILTDIDRSLNMDPEDLKAKITPRTKVIIPVHMLGVPCDMDAIMAIAASHKIWVLEDTAQAVGGTYKGKNLGTIGKLGTFSFDHGKLLTTGEGGMIAVKEEPLYLWMRAYHDHGHESNPAVPRGRDTRSFGGFNYRMNELQGAIGLAQLAKLDFALSRQRENKARLKKVLTGFKGITLRELPDEPGDCGDALVFFLENPEQAAEIAGRLQKHGIGFKNLPDAMDWHFAGTWDHLFQGLPEYEGKVIADLWKKSEFILKSAIALPIMIKMEQDMDRIIAGLEQVLGKL